MTSTPDLHPPVTAWELSGHHFGAIIRLDIDLDARERGLGIVQGNLIAVDHVSDRGEYRTRLAVDVFLEGQAPLVLEVDPEQRVTFPDR